MKADEVHGTGRNDVLTFMSDPGTFFGESFTAMHSLPRELSWIYSEPGWPGVSERWSIGFQWSPSLQHDRKSP